MSQQMQPSPSPQANSAIGGGANGAQAGVNGASAVERGGYQDDGHGERSGGAKKFFCCC